MAILEVLFALMIIGSIGASLAVAARVVFAIVGVVLQGVFFLFLLSLVCALFKHC